MALPRNHQNIIKPMQIIGFLLLFLIACTERPPKNTADICLIFQEKPQWHQAAKQASQRWGVSIPILMAIMARESSFIANAKPKRKLLWGFIPWTRPSTAYGYAQAINSTWKAYQNNTGHFNAKRNEFSDAIDFIGWYTSTCQTRLGLSLQNAKQLYLAYYEGLDGYANKNYLKRKGLVKTAEKVAHLAALFQKQLKQCQIN